MARFLFPEDEPTIRELCQLIVTAAGHVMDGVENGLEARDRVQTLEYDAIISDGDMPGMSGPTFLREVEDIVRRRVPCALKSAHPLPVLFRQGMPLGVRWFVQKPFELEELVAACEDMRRVRVQWLLTSQPMSILPTGKGGEWVDLDGLGGAAHMAALVHGGVPMTMEGKQVFHAPSPRAAARFLAATVRHWPSMLEGPEVKDSRDGLTAAMRERTSRERENEVVRLGDEELRREAVEFPEPLRTRVYLALSCARFGWRWRVGDDVELVVDAPVEAHTEHGTLHSETGPAIRYRDGWCVHALRGVRVDRHVVDAPDTLTVEEIRSTRNAEVRRIMRERFGEERYIRESGATLVHADTVPVDALVSGGETITRALLEDDEGDRFLVASDGSTSRVYYMQVPRNCSTCQEAYVALSGRDGVRTIMQA